MSNVRCSIILSSKVLNRFHYLLISIVLLIQFFSFSFLSSFFILFSTAFTSTFCTSFLFSFFLLISFLFYSCLGTLLIYDLLTSKTLHYTTTLHHNTTLHYTTTHDHSTPQHNTIVHNNTTL